MAQESEQWFHLSDTPIEGKYITEVRMSENDYADVDEPSFSLAPSVWQCVFSIPRKTGVQHIYKVEVKNPESAITETNDGWITNEHRITQRVLEDNGGCIAVSLLGTLALDKDLKEKVKINFAGKKLTCSHEQEMEYLWSISKNRIWSWSVLPSANPADSIEKKLSKNPNRPCGRHKVD